jgi:uncharacterized protein (DUF1778 family)
MKTVVSNSSTKAKSPMAKNFSELRSYMTPAAREQANQQACLMLEATSEQAHSAWLDQVVSKLDEKQVVQFNAVDDEL